MQHRTSYVTRTSPSLISANPPSNTTDLPSNSADLPPNSADLPPNSAGLPPNSADLPPNSTDHPQIVLIYPQIAPPTCVFVWAGMKEPVTDARFARSLPVILGTGETNHSNCYWGRRRWGLGHCYGNISLRIKSPKEKVNNNSLHGT